MLVPDRVIEKTVRGRKLFSELDSLKKTLSDKIQAKRAEIQKLGSQLQSPSISEAGKEAIQKQLRDLDFEDKKLQRELREAANALKEASNALNESPKKSRRRKGGLGRTLLLLTIAATLALVLSEDLRSKVLDLLFGAEEEFDYSSTTAPAEPAPVPTPAA